MPNLFAMFSPFLRLQVLISTVSDLLLKLMEADGQSGCLVRAYVEHVTPDKTEWGKLHESLCSEVWKC